MNYPLISEYIEAIKSAKDNFEELSYLRPVMGDDGLPVIANGNFAVVFKMKDERNGKLYAVKCFTKEQEGRAEAYRLITVELEDVYSPYLYSVRYLDKELFVLLAKEYFNNQPSNNVQVEKLANTIYSKSIFCQKEKLISLLEKGDIKAIKKYKNDVLATFAYPIFDNYIKNTQIAYNQLKTQLDSLNRIWTKALMEMQTDKHFYPDANLTLRVAYGKVGGYSPKDGVQYKHYTTIEGIMQKENPDIYDYVVEPKLKQLYLNKDYGRYANAKGELPVAFVATNHTTGGNSGSPVLNANGQLIGLNFDRCWEGTMSDIEYDPDQCRNITLDIRYCLFIIDKFAGAQRLIDEMTIVD